MAIGIDQVVAEVMSELLGATEKYRTMQSAHEGYAVILEELDEAWDEIKKKRPDSVALRKEMIQVAAMAMRFIIDVTP